jgi:protein-S-isoprenylcysteine O-methyltransferase Ste14
MMLFLKNVLFTILVPGSVGVMIPLLIVEEMRAATGVIALLSLFPLGAGAVVYTWCVWDFAAFGRGTPAPIDAPKKLVVRGLYRLTRNPMYVGVLLVILGLAGRYESTALLVYAACVALAFNLFIVAYEEPHLTGEFGDEYTAYKSRVGRWLPKRPE